MENVIGENAVTNGITDWGVEGYKKAIDESQSGYNAPNVADVSNIKGVGDFTDWASYQLGKGLPMLGSLVLSGGVGGAVARLTAKEGIKQIAKGAVGSAVKKGELRQKPFKQRRPTYHKDDARGRSQGIKG